MKIKLPQMLLFMLMAITSSVFAQNTCGTAEQLVVGSIAVDFTTKQEQWFTYTTSSEEELIMISSESYVVATKMDDCNWTNSIDVSNGNGGSIGLAANTTYLFVFSNWDSKVVNIDFSSRAIELGDLCSNAFDAVEGTNTVDLSIGDKWLTYTPNQDGMLTLENSASNGNTEWLKQYTDCSSSYSDNTIYNSKYAFEVSANQTYYFKALSGNTISLSFELSIREIEDGDLCSNAFDAVEGTNTIDLSKGDKWLTYTPVQDGMLTLEKTGSRDEWLERYTECSGYIDKYIYNSKYAFEVSANQTYYFKALSSNATSLSFELSIREIEDGDLCSNAFDAVEGTNTVDLSKGDKWLTYTPVQDGMLTLKNTGSNRNYWLEQYTDCSNDYSDKNFYRSKYTFEVSANQTYYFKALSSNATSLSFELSIRDIEQGDLCSNPLTANDGNNTAITSTGEKWFTYTASVDGLLSIERTGEFTGYSSVDLKRNCDSYMSEGDNGLTAIVEKDQTYLIKWENSYSEDVQWNLSERILEAGEECTTALTCNDGVNDLSINAYEKHYSYTATTSGLLSVEAIGVIDARIGLYNDCNSNSLARSDNEITYEVEAGDIFIIKWESDKVITDTQFNVSVSTIEAGELCSDAFAIGTEGAQTSDLSTGGKWYTYTPTKEGVLEVTSNGLNKNVKVKIVRDCEDYYDGYYYSNYNAEGNETVSVGRIIYDNAVNSEFLIYIEDANNSASFSWNIQVRDFKEGENPDIPKQAIEGVNIVDNYVVSYNFYTYTATEAGTLKFKINQVLEDVCLCVWKGGFSFEGDEVPIMETESRVSELVVESGVTYMIAVNSDEMNTEFTWNMSFVKGDLAIEESVAASMVSLYPNPVIDQLNIQLEDNSIQTVQVYSMSGVLAYAMQDVDAKSVKLDIQLPSDSYIVRIVDNKGDSYSKIILVK